jgi:outer membrane protein OmpA-like peptidoglycan-associated protein
MGRITALVTIFILSIRPTFAQQSESYYVTIGVFSNVSNAERLIKRALEQGYDAQYTLHPEKKLNYAYVLATGDKRKAFALAVKLRAETEYKDAWVFEGSLADAVTEPVIEKKNEPVVEVKALEPEVKPIIDSSDLKKPVERPIVEKKLVGKPFYFRLRNVADNSEVKSGEVHVQEAVRATQYQAFKPGEVVYLEAPKNKRGSYTVVTQVPGYSPLTTVFNYQNPAGQKGGSDEVIIELPVTKAKKGDYVDFNNVKFYKNSSILQAGSQNELDGLVDLLRENLKYKVKIHGHVNGTQSRECFVRGANSGFFATNPSADKTEKNMSAKELSNLRAETVKDYLVSQGIDASRLNTKGEGGKIPLYPEGGSLGPLIDRIEIEFTKN